MKHWNCTVWIADKQNDSCISLEWSFQWNTGIVLQVNCFYHFVTHLSWVSYSQHSAQMNNKMITAAYLQKDSSISLKWSFKWNAEIVLLISYPNSTIPVFHWNDDNNNTLFAFNLIWPLNTLASTKWANRKSRSSKSI